MRNKILTIGLILAIAVSAVTIGLAYSGSAPNVLIENVESLLIGGAQDETEFGGTTAASWTAADLISTDDTTVGDDLTVTDDASISGDLTITGNSTFGDQINVTPGTITATTTLTSASESVQLFGNSASMITVTLPAAATGTVFRFQVAGALTGANVLIDSAEGDNIDGTLIVAGAVVDCRGEDQINIVTDGEAIGDYVELYGIDGAWLIVDSGVLTAAKMTCTDPS